MRKTQTIAVKFIDSFLRKTPACRNFIFFVTKNRKHKTKEMELLEAWIDHYETGQKVKARFMFDSIFRDCATSRCSSNRNDEETIERRRFQTMDNITHEFGFDLSQYSNQGSVSSKEGNGGESLVSNFTHCTNEGNGGRRENENEKETLTLLPGIISTHHCNDRPSQHTQNTPCVLSTLENFPVRERATVQCDDETARNSDTSMTRPERKRQPRQTCVLCFAPKRYMSYRCIKVSKRIRRRSISIYHNHWRGILNGGIYRKWRTKYIGQLVLSHFCVRRVHQIKLDQRRGTETAAIRWMAYQKARKHKRKHISVFE